ncbi:flagellar hook protein FlgE [Swingsia samuiensis]|uniref:Flagellar hook protein FlgE n=1 Tax=Swingsia samuiensis TaxID=1293412 RepID=A0A4Y6UH22_9PROT|nr:flagellar hook protein FlgE [Swingsia samuiensis]QDH16879.1 flagellar hook protein FlgE [Swingsia samuiensis]
MSIFNSLNTAVSGLNAQSHAFSDLSNNIANSQTVGYKATTTSFENYVTNNSQSTSGQNTSDDVIASTQQHNDNQGMVVSSSDSLALAISGNGFFNVAQPSMQAGSNPTSQFYTRNGDFTQNNKGFLVNSSGYYLEGYQNDSNGVLQSNLAPIQIPLNIPFKPTQTTTVSISSPIGSTNTTGASNTSQTTVYDSAGQPHQVALNWKQSSQNPLSWTVSNASNPSNFTTLQFNSDGSLASVNGQNQSAGSEGTFNYQGSPQNIAINLGMIGSTTGASLAVGNNAFSHTISSSSDSITSGQFIGISMQSNGDVTANFDNGLSQQFAKIPLATFSDPNALALQNGQAYTATENSGSASIKAVNTNGAGQLVTSSLEGSTTDLTKDLTRLIVAQQAYGANTKVVTTANQLLQTTLAMIQ